MAVRLIIDLITTEIPYWIFEVQKVDMSRARVSLVSSQRDWGPKAKFQFEA